jgi:hypothetical protein
VIASTTALTCNDRHLFRLSLIMTLLRKTKRFVSSSMAVRVFSEHFLFYEYLQTKQRRKFLYPRGQSLKQHEIIKLLPSEFSFRSEQREKVIEIMRMHPFCVEKEK